MGGCKRAARIAGAAVFLFGAAVQARGGFMADVGLGVGEANFDLDTKDDEGDLGALFGADFGYGFQNGFAVTGGFNMTAFAYELQFLGEPTGVEFSIALTMVEATGWYFYPLGGHVELYGKLGLGPTTGTTELKLSGETLSKDTSSFGGELGGGANFYISENGMFSLFAELYHRRYGLEFTSEPLKGKEIYTSGLVLGGRWR